MNNVSALLIKNIATLDVTFPNSNRNPDKEFKFKFIKDEDNEIKAGNLVIVPSLSEKSFLIAKVKRVHRVPKISPTSSDDDKLTWIVQKVCFKTYDSIIKNEEKFADELQEIQQEKVVSQAISMLTDKLGADPLRLQASIARLNNEEVSDNEIKSGDTKRDPSNVSTNDDNGDDGGVVSAGEGCAANFEG